MINSVQSLSENIIAELVGLIAISVTAWIRAYIIRRRIAQDPRVVSTSFLLVIAAWIGANSVVLTLSINRHAEVIYIVAFPLMSSLLLLCILWSELNRFWRVGLNGADQQIGKGIGYKQALALCKNELSFMGTGARKLTQQENFEATVCNCRRDRPIRFLLSEPTDITLIEAARGAGRPEHEYRDRVIESLRTLAKLKTDRSLNLEVRFYPKDFQYKPIFRLMIIDDAICLLSYNYFGEEGEGSQLPQLHMTKPVGTGHMVKYTFFYPLQQYFEWLWGLSIPWDFKEFLIDG